MHNPEPLLENETHKLLRDILRDTNGSSNTGHTIRPSYIQQQQKDKLSRQTSE